MLGTISALVLAVSATPYSGPDLSSNPPDAEDAPLLIRAERVIVRPGKELTGVSVLVERGRIVAVGEGLAAPEGARLIEGGVVCAGFLDPWSNLGLDPGTATDESTSPGTRAVDGLDRYSHPEWLLDALRGGVTAARLQAGGRARLGGLGAVVRFDTELDAAAAVVLEDACVQATVGTPRGGRSQDPFARIGDADRVTAALEKGTRYHQAALKYRSELEEWEKEIAESTEKLEKDFKKTKKARDKKEKEAKEKDKEFKEEKYKEDKKPREPKFDPDSEVLARVANGAVPLVVEVHQAPEIRAVLNAVEPFTRVRLILAGATEAGAFAEELAERRVPVILWPTPLGTSRPSSHRSHDLALAGVLAKAGVDVLIGSGGEDGARDLRLLAGLAVGHGLDRDAALHAITLGPARAFDVGDRLGSVERGKDADLLVLDGDPLDSASRVLFVVTKGRVAVEL